MKLVAIPEMSKSTGIPEKTLSDRRWRARVGLRAVKLGTRVFFREEDVERLIAKHLEKLPVSTEGR